MRGLKPLPHKRHRYRPGRLMIRLWLYGWMGWSLVGAHVLAGEVPQTRRERAWAREMAAGSAAYEDGLYRAARDFFEKALGRARATGQRTESVLWLARALYRLGDFGSLSALLVREMEADERAEWRSIYRFWLARAHYAQGHYSDALVELQALDAGVLGQREAAQRLRMAGRAHSALGDAEAALVYFQQYESGFDDWANAHAANRVDMAAALVDLGRHDAAHAHLHRVIDDYPETPAAQVARLWLGTAAVAAGEQEEARAWLTAVIDGEPDASDWAAEAGFGLALLAEESEDWGQVLAALAAARSRARTAAVRHRGHLLQARAHFRLNEWDAGTELLRETVAALPAHELARMAQLELAEALLDQERYRDALEAFQDYLEAFDDEVGRANAWLGRAWSLLGLRRPVEAAEAFEAAYQSHPGIMERQQALFKMGDAFFAAANYKRAREEYLLIPRVFPGSTLMPRALFQAAECLARTGALDEAMQEFRALEDAFPGSRYAAKAAMRIAHLQEEQGEWERAIRAYSRMIQTYPHGEWYSQALHRRGLTRYRLGLFEEALADFERVVESFPESESMEQAYYMRGWCLYLLGYGSRALAVARDFIERYPGSAWQPDVLFWVASYHFNEGEFAAAEQKFAAIVDSGQRSDVALYWAGRAAMEQEAFLRAMEYFNRLATDYPQSAQLVPTRFAQGDALVQLGEYAGAILAFDEVIRRPVHADLRYRAWGRKGDCHFMLGHEDPARWQEALQAYRTVMESEDAPESLRGQAEFKVGRTLEQLDQVEEALEHYLRVTYAYVNGVATRGAENTQWFTRAAFAAAALKEARGDWSAAIRILQRVVDAEVVAAPDAQTRIERIRTEREGANNHA